MTWNSIDGIYEGFWTDWTLGSIRGRTLTLGPTTTVILTNSLAMFVTLCSVQIWAIVRYVLHLYGPHSQKPEQILSSPQISQQLILRNTGSALTTAVMTIELIWDYRKRAWKLLVRPYGIVVWAALYAALFTIAGVFSNKAISAVRLDGASAVLLRSDTCGLFTDTYYRIINDRGYDDATEFNIYSEDVAMISREVQRSLQYAQQCYLPSDGNSDMSSTCHILKNATIGSIMPVGGTCPFGRSICTDDRNTIVFDTGDIDTHEHLGINSKPEDRLRYRRITTCSVLNDTGRVTGWDGTVINASMPRPISEGAVAYFGPSYNQKTPWTYSMSNFASFYDNFTAKVTSPYSVDIEFSPAVTDPQWSFLDFEPIQDLAQNSSDISLIFLSYTGQYLDRVDDPWFSAQNAQTFSNPMPFLRTRYTRDRPIGVLGCTEQHNVCTHNGTCTGLLGGDQFQNVESFNSILSPRQAVTFDRLTKSTQRATILQVVQLLSQTTQPLLASLTVQSGNSGIFLSAGLPPDQWKIELQFWHSIVMAHLQRNIILWATGQIASDPKYIDPAKDDADVWFCDNVVVPSSVYQSFSVLAIINIMVFGTLLILTGLFMTDLADFFAHCFHRESPASNWKRDGMLALQRRKSRARGRLMFSPRVNDYEMTSPRYTHRAGTSPNLSVGVPNSTRVSSQVLPHNNPKFLSPNIYVSPPMPTRPTEQSETLRDRQNSPSWMPIILDESSPKSPVLYEAANTQHFECVPTLRLPYDVQNSYDTAKRDNDLKTSRILSWMRTLQPEHPNHNSRAWRRSGSSFV